MSYYKNAGSVHKRNTLQLFFALLCVAFGCSKEKANNGEISKDALISIQAKDLLHHISVLSSDRFEGRAPGTAGEALTVEYLADQFKRAGLAPGSQNGTFFQDIPMVASETSSTAWFSIGKKKLALEYPADYVAASLKREALTRVENSEMVFVGYGTIAPEYGWDDYKDADVQGKTLVMLINDPQVSDPVNRAQLDVNAFKGQAMTYYGRWTYKFELAAQKGASAVILVHEKGPAGYPYEVLTGSWGRELFALETSENNPERLTVETWITQAVAKKLFSLAGRNFEAMKKSALSRSFHPVSIGAKANFYLKNQVRNLHSKNVIAVLEGSDPKLKGQCVIYSAHWDHLGKNDGLKGDQIYNGALDNASGTAALLEIAKAYSKLKKRPRRSIIFLALTAEEKGMLGAKYYTDNPIYPLERTVADINIDCLNPWGRTRDVVIIGWGETTLDDILSRIAGLQGRRVGPDLQTEKGFFYRSDHFEFAKKGVPVLFMDAGNDWVDKPAEYGQRKRGAFTERDYHQVSDEVKPDWDLSGAVEDLRLLFRVGYEVAQKTEPPRWKSSSESLERELPRIPGRQ